MTTHADQRYGPVVNLDADDKALVDLAVAFTFSPFEKCGDPNEPPCD